MVNEINKLATYVNKLEMNELTNFNCHTYGAIVHAGWYKTTVYTLNEWPCLNMYLCADIDLNLFELKYYFECAYCCDGVFMVHPLLYFIRSFFFHPRIAIQSNVAYLLAVLKCYFACDQR